MTELQSSIEIAVKDSEVASTTMAKMEMDSKLHIQRLSLLKEFEEKVHVFTRTLDGQIDGMSNSLADCQSKIAAFDQV